MALNPLWRNYGAGFYTGIRKLVDNEVEKQAGKKYKWRFEIWVWVPGFPGKPSH